MNSDQITLSNRRYDSTITESEAANPSIYVEERVKYHKNTQETHIYRCLKELCKQIKEFKTFYLLSVEDQDGYFEDRLGMKKRLRISFSDEEEIKQITKVDEFKINTRSILGVKNTNDWIYGLNIGNIMHLTPLALDDLKNEFASETPEQLELELTNESILEKIIFLASAYF